mmetsp:Transcript_107585/g.181934  ORF Transcript_107585/g.181934 Transcript_107585/m.181934 type:complete len:100 (+) Transcript_107585:458-757(+)
MATLKGTPITNIPVTTENHAATELVAHKSTFDDFKGTPSLHVSKTCRGALKVVAGISCRTGVERSCQTSPMVKKGLCYKMPSNCSICIPALDNSTSSSS